MNDFHFLQHVNNRVSGLFTSVTLLISFYFSSSSRLLCSLPIRRYQQLCFVNGFHDNGQKTSFRLPPLLFWMKHKHNRETESLACWLAPSILLLCYHAHSLHRSLLLQPSLSCGFSLSLSLTYLVCSLPLCNNIIAMTTNPGLTRSPAV